MGIWVSSFISSFLFLLLPAIAFIAVCLAIPMLYSLIGRALRKSNQEANRAAFDVAWQTQIAALSTIPVTEEQHLKNCKVTGQSPDIIKKTWGAAWEAYAPRMGQGIMFVSQLILACWKPIFALMACGVVFGIFTDATTSFILYAVAGVTSGASALWVLTSVVQEIKGNAGLTKMRRGLYIALRTGFDYNVLSAATRFIRGWLPVSHADWLRVWKYVRPNKKNPILSTYLIRCTDRVSQQKLLSNLPELAPLNATALVTWLDSLKGADMHIAGVRGVLIEGTYHVAVLVAHSDDLLHETVTMDTYEYAVHAWAHEIKLFLTNTLGRELPGYLLLSNLHHDQPGSNLWGWNMVSASGGEDIWPETTLGVVWDNPHDPIPALVH